MPKPILEADPIVTRTSPPADAAGREIQRYGEVVARPIALADGVRADSIASLNQMLADTMTLRDLYKKHHWQVSGATFHQLHLLFDTHYQQQSELVDTLAERIHLLGGVSVAMAHDVTDLTVIPRPPKGREDAAAQIARLLQAHEIVLRQARAMARQAADRGDDGSNDLLVGGVIRANELQAWFLAGHVVEAP